MTNFGPTLETERLILRVPQAADFERFAEVLGNEEAARYVGGAQPRAAIWRRFLQMPGAWLLQGFGMFSILDKASGRWLGQAGPWKPEGWPGNEIGWTFHPDTWGKGYATEAATAAIDWAFANLDWDDVIHCIDPANAASQALARRLGSRNLGAVTLPAPFEDVPSEAWGQARAEWLDNRKRFA